jgi:two-component system sensor histidine kinase AlgZ
VRTLHTLAMCALFALVAPAAWRLFLGGVPATPARVAAYALIGLAVVLGAGLGGARALGLRATLLVDPAGLPVTQVLFWVGGWGLGRDIELARSLDRARQAAEHAQLLALKSHLDPHFLFNTLNAIAEWCREDPLVAEQATLRLAAMLRLVFDGVRAERWPLARELELVDALWALHRARDPERFDYEVGEGTAIEVPPLLLLPLAENAMTHGVWRGARGPVRLAVHDVDGVVTLAIESPGAYAPTRAGHGLESVRQRLELAFGARARLTVGGAPDDPSRTRAVVVMPRRA